MSSPAPWPNNQFQPPLHAQSAIPAQEENQDGVSLKELKLKILYTFDDQSQTNFLVRPPETVRIQTVVLDEGTVIGVIDLSTCLQAIVQSSPELLARLNQDYTVYAYDFSEYDTPLVGQGMLSKALAAPLPSADPNERQVITGRVCENIIGRIPGMRANAVKETLEVKLRLVPVPTANPIDLGNGAQRPRGINRATPTNFDPAEWNALVQPVQAMSRGGTQSPLLFQPIQTSRDQDVRMSSPQLQLPPPIESYAQSANGDASGNESQTGGKGKKGSRPSSRASVKRPRPRKPKAAPANGGNTSGYEEGTDGDDVPVARKRAKITKADRSNNAAFGTGRDSLRVAASTAGSLRTFRPIAICPNPGPGAGSHLQEIPRAPTPVPNQPNQHLVRDRSTLGSGLRRESSASMVEAPVRQHISPYPALTSPEMIEDDIRKSIESANPSPERSYSPAITPQDIASSPPLMRTRPPTEMRSSPPCPSSPVLPEMPRTDSGFMSGSLEELFGEDEDGCTFDEEEPVQVEPPPKRRRAQPSMPSPPEHFDFFFEEPGPRENLPTRMPIIENPKQVDYRAKAAISRAGSVMSEDGQTLPPLKGRGSRFPSYRPPMSQSQPSNPFPPVTEGVSMTPDQAGTPQFQPQQASVDPQPRPGSRQMIRTASMGSLTLPSAPANEQCLPLSSLHRSQTWSETPHPTVETPDQVIDLEANDAASAGPAYSRTLPAKKASIKSKLLQAIENGEPPPFCTNCGAIDTSTWRRAWSKSMEGAPSFIEYSEEPGRITAVSITSRDADGRPTSYDLIKKALLADEKKEDFVAIVLCNPCGIWMSKYKCHRPEERWRKDGPQPRTRGGGGDKKRNRSKKSQASNAGVPTSEANFPQSESNFPPSDANFPQSEAYQPYPDMNRRSEMMGPPSHTLSAEPTFHALSVEPIPSALPTEVEIPQADSSHTRSNSFVGNRRRNPIISSNAPDALRRAIQSSPAKWGTRHTPIDVEEEEEQPVRRLLFSSPRTAGTPKVLGPVVTNIVQVATDFHSPKETSAEIGNKENRPPLNQDVEIDHELVKFLEHELSKEAPARPTTPVQKTTGPNPFKTPTRQTPTHPMITRSASAKKSNRSVRIGSPSQHLLFRTPTRTSARRNPPLNFESPFTASINQMNQFISENHHNLSPSRNLELDFSNMPDLPALQGGHHMDMNFSLEDIFSTDVPMPSSPPRPFHLYEDPMTMSEMNNLNWDDFGQFDGKELEKMDGVVVKEEPVESPVKLGEKDQVEDKVTA